MLRFKYLVDLVKRKKEKESSEGAQSSDNSCNANESSARTEEEEVLTNRCEETEFTAGI